jgi:hypothetical protein
MGAGRGAGKERGEKEGRWKKKKEASFLFHSLSFFLPLCPPPFPPALVFLRGEGSLSCFLSFSPPLPDFPALLSFYPLSLLPLPSLLPP